MNGNIGERKLKRGWDSYPGYETDIRNTCNTTHISRGPPEKNHNPEEPSKTKWQPRRPRIRSMLYNNEAAKKCFVDLTDTRF